MEFLKILPLRGPNIWTYRPVIEVWLDIGTLEDSPSNTIPGLQFFDDVDIARRNHDFAAEADRAVHGRIVGRHGEP